MRLSPLLGTVFLVALLLPAGGCASPVGPLNDAVSVTVTAEGLVIVNRSTSVIHVLAAERGTLALLDFVPCTAGPDCFEVTAGATRLLPWSKVVGYATGKAEYAVFWWGTVVQPDGSLRPDIVFSKIVTR